ncbi:uncharacterized protein LOC111369168 [Olea europaea var. sylvestris]|uniref:uncharacterized protein LOC111369168 n=1 Tax=Olea europaea var. sylvestris TaxID=158386 RepID=UPI000C1D7B18|nr:uncharacterized protein LOC111369168 [Olea europaea var. sylvestris]
MILDHQLTLTTTPLYGFTGDSITLKGKITLAVKMGESLQTTMNFMEFFIVDNQSTYHGVLGRPALKELGAVSSIHHLCMKFSTENGVATVRGDQRGSRECYLSSIKKVEPRDVHVIIADIVMADVPGDAPTEPQDIDMIYAPPNSEVLVIDEIDPRIIEHEPQAFPVGNLKTSWYEALKEEVHKLIQNGFIREATYPRIMPFGLKNVEATYQRLVNKMFIDLIGKMIYRMMLNPLKCAFGVASGKFLGYMVNQRRIEANLEKIEALYKMRGLSRPEKAPGAGPLLSKPKPEEILQLYLVVSNEAISSVLTREEGTTQLPVYYTSKALLSPETRYPDMEKLALALIKAFRKLRPYFQAHTIHVLTNFRLRQVLRKLDASGRLLKWAVELSEFDLVFKARAAIKGQALADFVAEFTNLPEVDEIMDPVEPPTWNLFVDGLAGDTDSGARVVLINPEGHKLNSTMRFGFKATNNVEEYEALLAGLRLAKEMQVKRLFISSDSQLVINQVNGNFLTKDKTMASYLKMVMNLIPSFEKFELTQIPCIENSHADALSKLTSSKDSEQLTVVPIKHLLLPSTEAPNVMWEEVSPLPLVDDVLYKRSFSSPLLRCVGGQKATYTLREVHEGVCDNNSGGLSLAQKILRQGPWPFSKWGVDFMGLLPKGRGGASFALVAIDYFNKWVETMVDNSTTRRLEHYARNSASRNISPRLTTHKQMTRLRLSTKQSNKSLKGSLMCQRGPGWMSCHKYFARSEPPRGPKTPFLMAFGTEAMSPVEVGLPSPRRLHFSEMTNDELRRCDLNFIDERIDDSQL